MAKLWYKIITAPGSTKTIDDVPEKYREEVRRMLEENGYI